MYCSFKKSCDFPYIFSLTRSGQALCLPGITKIPESLLLWCSILGEINIRSWRPMKTGVMGEVKEHKQNQWPLLWFQPQMQSFQQLRLRNVIILPVP